MSDVIAWVVSQRDLHGCAQVGDEYVIGQQTASNLMLDCIELMTGLNATSHERGTAGESGP